MSTKLMEYFNKMPRLGSLSTAGKDGKIDVAIFGSPKMIDEKRVVMGTRKNRTFANLQENLERYRPDLVVAMMGVLRNLPTIWLASGESLPGCRSSSPCGWAITAPVSPAAARTLRLRAISALPTLMTSPLNMPPCLASHLPSSGFT